MSYGPGTCVLLCDAEIALKVRTYGTLRDPQLAGDLLITQAVIQNESQDFCLPLSRLSSAPAVKHSTGGRSI